VSRGELIPAATSYTTLSPAPARQRQHTKWLERCSLPVSAGAVPRATSWSSTAGPPCRCSAATAPAPAAREPAAAMTASWRTRPNLSPPGPSLQGCLLRQCIPPGQNIHLRTSWRAAKMGRPNRENGCSVTSRRSACPAQDRCPAAPSTSCRCVRALGRLVTPACTMTFAVVARLICDTSLARMSAGQ
jgi:hypothetical protein